MLIRTTSSASSRSDGIPRLLRQMDGISLVSTRRSFREVEHSSMSLEIDIFEVAELIAKVQDTELAGMPYIATRHHQRRKGFSKMLFTILESILSMLGVEHLVIPSVQEKTFTSHSSSPASAAAVDLDDDHAGPLLLDLNQEPPMPPKDELARPVPLP
ncbi:hypothetical protein Tsubulata_030012 [Turnera subulata]|uniref:Increased DNA methylation 1 C-terminal domain-containing protein n=1 Tax=Turnera subulata TaxID=218843 RepID=A0A9Q0G0G8_9ROSI|nr:hypothetical protein Tsubulata_030012 [Turnera subulata]